MSELERYRRSQGFRAAVGPDNFPAVPVIDACLMRMDAPAGQDPGAVARGAGSIIFGACVDPGVGGIGAGQNLIQLPGAAPIATAGITFDPTRFFQPGHWVVDFSLLPNITTNPFELLLGFAPVTPGVSVDFRAFIGTPTAQTLPALATALIRLQWFSISVNLERHFHVEAFFPEPWVIVVQSGSIALVDNDRLQLNGSAQLHCPLDDVPAALTATLLRS